MKIEHISIIIIDLVLSENGMNLLNNIVQTLIRNDMSN